MHNNMTIICKMVLGFRMHVEINTKYVNCHNMDAQGYLISCVRDHKTIIASSRSTIHI